MVKKVGKKRKLKLREKFFMVFLSIVIIITAISNFYQFSKKSMLAFKLKTGSEILEKGFKNAIADNDTNSITNTILWKVCDIRNIDNNSGKCETELKKYFMGVKTYKKKHRSEDTVNTYYNRNICKKLVGKSNMWWHLNSNSKCSGWDNYTFNFNNGMKADALIIGENDSYLAGQLIIDVNGDKAPNRWGRDTFMFNILKDGTMIPYAGTNDCSKLAKYTNNSIEYVLKQKHWKHANTCSSTTSSDGTACAARIIENGWKMDY